MLVVTSAYCIFLFQLEEFRIHNVQRTHAETAYSGTTTPSKFCYIGHWMSIVRGKKIYDQCGVNTFTAMLVNMKT